MVRGSTLLKRKTEVKNENINIGNFNEPITWQAPTLTTAASGQKLRSFADYKTVYADVSPLTINEGEVSARIQYAETYAFTTHYDAAINSRYQVRYNGESYNIIKLETLNLKRFTRATATKIVQ